MQTILTDSDYTFNASAKTITLVAPYNNTSEARIRRIVNFTTRAVIYEVGRAEYPISVSAGVITHTYSNISMQDTDELQIIIGSDSEYDAVVQDWTSVPQNTLVKSSKCDLPRYGGIMLHIQAALDTTTAHTGTRFVVQTSGTASGNEDWQDWADFVALIGTAATDLIEDDPLAAGSTAIALTTHVLTAEGVLLFIEDATLADSEIGMEASQSANEVVLLDGTTNAHAVNTAIFNVAMTQNVALPSSARRARVVVDNTYDDNGSTLNYRATVSRSAEV